MQSVPTATAPTGTTTTASTDPRAPRRLPSRVHYHSLDQHHDRPNCQRSSSHRRSGRSDHPIAGHHAGRSDRFAVVFFTSGKSYLNAESAEVNTLPGFFGFPGVRQRYSPITLRIPGLKQVDQENDSERSAVPDIAGRVVTVAKFCEDRRRSDGEGSDRARRHAHPDRLGQERPLRPGLPGPDPGRGDQGLPGDARGVRRHARPERDDQPEPVDQADAAVVPDGDREPDRLEDSGWSSRRPTSAARSRRTTFPTPQTPSTDEFRFRRADG